MVQTHDILFCTKDLREITLRKVYEDTQSQCWSEVKGKSLGSSFLASGRRE